MSLAVRDISYHIRSGYGRDNACQTNFQFLRGIAMKKLPDEKTLLEMLEHFKLAEQAAREMSELSTAIALKYQKRMREIREARKK